MVDCYNKWSYLKLSTVTLRPAVKQSWFTDVGVSLILPQPTTSDGDDCSLEINKTTNLPDNFSSWGAVPDTARTLFIHLPVYTEDICEFCWWIALSVLIPETVCVSSKCISNDRCCWGIIWYVIQFINQYFHWNNLLSSINSKWSGFSVCTFYYFVLKGNTCT